MQLSLARTCAAGTTVLALLLIGIEARAASSKAQCYDAYEAAQRARKKGQLRAAQTQLARCAAAECPAFVAKDCAQWAREIDAVMPSVIFVAHDGSGADLVDVTVSVDGAEITRRLDGRATPVDPGSHRVRYAWNGKTVEIAVVLAEGDRNRRVAASFAPPEGPPPPPSEELPSEGVPTATLVLGGVALAAGASFAVFAILGKKQESCAPHCSSSEVKVMRRDYVIADVSWISGIAAAGAAALVWTFRPSRASR